MNVSYEDYLDMGHLSQLFAMGDLSPAKREAAAKKLLEQQKLDYLAEIEAHAQAGEWEEVCSIITLRPLIMEEGFELYYNHIPDEMKYKFVTGLFTNHGDKHDNIRKALTKVHAYGKSKLPEWMGDTVTVYRGGCESIDEAPRAISWTTEQNVAEFFANRKTVRHGQVAHVYRAMIRAEDIIAFTNDRSEQEVMQYCSVYDVEEIPYTPGRVTRIDDGQHHVA
ncbi:MAG: hypothetical protein K6C08_01050 [Oscillospiraceae bacterium]|nr:hypothetical protein [Oscillospiraceae bacterium]